MINISSNTELKLTGSNGDNSSISSAPELSMWGYGDNSSISSVLDLRVWPFQTPLVVNYGSCGLREGDVRICPSSPLTRRAGPVRLRVTPVVWRKTCISEFN